MLIVKCAACKKKLWRYDKIGQGEVLRCHKDRIKKIYFEPSAGKHEHKIYCECGKEIALDKGSPLQNGRKILHLFWNQKKLITVSQKKTIQQLLLISRHPKMFFS